MNRMHRISQLHFVGIGGTGMSGIAEVMLNLGYQVSGTDLVETDVTRRLEDLGAQIAYQHASEHLGDADVLVVSSAVDEDNPEVAAARQRRIPVVPRAEMLGELMRFREGIAVAGSHGKTTTTSLLAALLAQAGWDPTFIVGGLLNFAGTHGRLGEGRFMVAEADESDASFLLLKPTISIVTNIDADHLGTYQGNFDRLFEAFESFLHNLPFYGLAVIGIDDDQGRRLAEKATRKVLTFGLHEDADVRATDLRQEGLECHFKVHFPPGQDNSKPCAITLSLPGEHNVQNALAAMAVGWELGVDCQAMSRALSEFSGVGRRFNVLGEAVIGEATVTVVDDYGHHPREISATLTAARAAWPQRRIVLVFQPHRYTRTRDLMDDFARELAVADALVITEVYAAGEAQIRGAGGRALVRAVRSRGQAEPVFVENVFELPQTLEPMVRDGDVVLLQGAGTITRVAHDLATSKTDGEVAA